MVFNATVVIAAVIVLVCVSVGLGIRPHPALEMTMADNIETIIILSLFIVSIPFCCAKKLQQYKGI